MIESVDAFVKKHRLLREKSTIVIGVSGGPDSMALLDYLMKKKNKMDLELVVAHVDHMFRGRQSEEDAEFVEQYCHDNDIPVESVKRNVPLLIEETRTSSQQAARAARYEFFRSVMERYSAEYLALAHHGDDQIETMLMRMTRGTDIKGLSGIPVERVFHQGKIIRPFLGITKEEIVQHCKDTNIPYRIDPSNESESYTRNRYRKYVLPFLKEENVDVHMSFQRLSERVTEDENLLKTLAENAMESAIVQKCDKRMTLSVERFIRLANPLQRRGIHLILNYLYRAYSAIISHSHIEDCMKLIQSEKPSGSLDLPEGLTVRRSYDDCFFSFEKKRGQDGYTYHLEPGNVYQLPVGDLSFAQKGADAAVHMRKGKELFCFHSAQVQWPLVVRTRRDGDRMRPRGMRGSRKVKDIFIDEKLSKELRDIWPIIEDASGTIIWIPSIKYAHLPDEKGTNQGTMVMYFQNQGHRF